MRKVSIALVGIGGYGSLYARELLDRAASYGARFAAGIDPLPQHCPLLDELQSAGIPIFPGLADFYVENTADLVIISTPIQIHAELTVMALDHGSNVLCEKPLCATVQEARVMADAEQRAGRRVAVGYQWSFTKAIQALKKDAIDGVLGRPLRFKTKVYWERPESYYRRNNWAGHLKTGDGRWVLDSPVNNAAAHYLHNALYVTGGSVSTSARVLDIQAELYRANPIENYDTAALRCSIEDGAEILFYTAHPVLGITGPVLSYRFEHAVVEYDAGRHPGLVARFHDGHSRLYGDPEEESECWSKLWQSVDAVRTGQPPLCGIEAAMPHIVCMNGAQDSVPQITPFPEELVQVKESEMDRTSWVLGLQQAFDRCYAVNALPSELGELDWTIPGQKIDLQNYLSFPKGDAVFDT